MSNQNNINVRMATVADYPGVMAIGELFGGVDYLPVMYHKYLRDPTRGMFVAEVNNEIVAFGMTRNTREGKTSIAGGARVKSGYQGMGVFLRLTECIAASNPILPEIIGRLGTSHGDWRGLKKQKPDLLTSRIWLSYTTNDCGTLCGELGHSLKRSKIDVPCRISLTQAMEILSDPDHKWRLFPHGIFVINWEPYRLEPINLKLVAMDVKMDVVSSITEDNQSHAVSFGSFTQLKDRCLLFIDFYGASCNEMDVLAHMHKHLSLVNQSIIIGALVMDVSFPRYMGSDFIRKCMTDMESAPVLNDDGQIHVGLFDVASKL